MTNKKKSMTLRLTEQEFNEIKIKYNLWKYSLIIIFGIAVKKNYYEFLKIKYEFKKIKTELKFLKIDMKK